VSPDDDFSPTGGSSGINYSESFKKYKEILTTNPDSPVFKRTFSEFNNSLFGAVPSLGDNFVAEEGDYNLELEQFMADLLADLEDKDLMEDPFAELTLQSLPDLDDIEPTPKLPTVQSKHHISISVMSCVSVKLLPCHLKSRMLSAATLPSPPPNLWSRTLLLPQVPRQASLP